MHLGRNGTNMTHESWDDLVNLSILVSFNDSDQVFEEREAGPLVDPAPNILRNGSQQFRLRVRVAV